MDVTGEEGVKETETKQIGFPVTSASHRSIVSRFHQQQPQNRRNQGAAHHLRSLNAKPLQSEAQEQRPTAAPRSASPDVNTTNPTTPAVTPATPEKCCGVLL
ncbi:unnamed protein product [Vicia faba]|uniref:Uncharacterized protein n=1 Tax=Vicia faba TaxID=3906 RepID=A0AAV0YXG6_VICFA|nr:unnamed protein product [Vicia faba]